MTELPDNISLSSENALTSQNTLKAEDLDLLIKPEFLEKIKEYLQDFIDTVRHLMETTSSCIIDMTTIAEELDKFHKGATIASITGSSIGIAGGILTIVGLALIPVTLGASLIVSGVGIGVGVAGGVTGAGASLADSVNIKVKSKRVEELVNDINVKMKSLKEISDKINLEVGNIQCRLGGDKDVDITRLFGKSTIATLEISRLVQLSKITTMASRGAQLAARGLEAVAVISGVLAALFILLDAFFIVKGAKDLQNGSKTEEAARIRECVVNLQKIYLDLQEVDNSLCEPLNELLNTE